MHKSSFIIYTPYIMSEVGDLMLNLPCPYVFGQDPEPIKMLLVVKHLAW